MNSKTNDVLSRLRRQVESKLNVKDERVLVVKLAKLFLKNTKAAEAFRKELEQKYGKAAAAAIADSALRELRLDDYGDAGDDYEESRMVEATLNPREERALVAKLAKLIIKGNEAAEDRFYKELEQKYGKAVAADIADAAQQAAADDDYGAASDDMDYAQGMGRYAEGRMVEGDPGMERTAKLKNPKVGAAKTMGPDSDETVADDIEADSEGHMESIIARLRRSLAEQEDKAGKQRTAGLKMKAAKSVESESEADEDSIADDLQGKHKGMSVGKATKTMESRLGLDEKLMSRQEKILMKYRASGGKAMFYDDLPASVQAELRKVKDQETLWSDVDRWLNDHRMGEAKEGKAKCCQCEAMCEMSEMYEGEDGPMCEACWSGMSEAILATVPSKSNPEKSYEIHMGKDGNVYCTCPAWKYQKGVSPKDRTCKHIKTLYGAMASQAKLKIPKDAPAESVFPVDGNEAVVIESSMREIAALLSEWSERALNEEARSLSVIASEIRKDWKPVDYAAKPYLDAMSGLDSIDDSYGQDPGRSIVGYFLSNARSWKGPKAKEIKAELKKMMK